MRRYELYKIQEIRADVAQLVEHLHGKEKVTGSIPVVGSTLHCLMDFGQ